MLLVLVATVLAAGTLRAEPEFKAIRKEIRKLERSLTNLEDERAKADKALQENRRKQADADDDAKRRLKAEALVLAREAADKAEEVREQRQKLGEKQGELRRSAADYVIERLDDDGELNARLVDVLEGMAAWDDALGELPEVPEIRNLDGIRDPQERNSIRDGDKRRLQDFRKWAKGEAGRVDDEIKKIKKFIDNDDVYGNADAGAELTERAKGLKKTLETRKKRVAALDDSARKKLNELERNE